MKSTVLVFGVIALTAASPATADHLYTTNPGAERLNSEYIAEGTEGYVFLDQAADMVQVYRFRNSRDYHFYTTDRNEGTSAGYTYESQPFSCSSKKIPGTMKLSRWRSNKDDSHFYTTRSGEPSAETNMTEEAGLCYVFTTQIAGTTPLYRFNRIGRTAPKPCRWQQDPNRQNGPYDGFIYCP